MGFLFSCKSFKHFPVASRFSFIILLSSKEALNKYRHSQIFRILNGSWESFDDFQPLSPSPGLEIGLYGF
jgi:hypothetical protein